MCYILENYLDDILEKDKTINYNIFNEYNKFDYDNKDLFEIDLKFLLDNIYSEIKIVESKVKRLNQQEFRSELINKYQKCLITDNDCLNELEACHIFELKDTNTGINTTNNTFANTTNNNANATNNNANANIDINNINNGLLLCSNLHKTFDKYLWTINPDTLEIEIANYEQNIIGSIYTRFIKNPKVLLDMNKELYNNLKHRYNKFISYKL
jgi:predicted restriction endonuclease